MAFGREVWPRMVEEFKGLVQILHPLANPWLWVPPTVQLNQKVKLLREAVSGQRERRKGPKLDLERLMGVIQVSTKTPSKHY